MAALLFSASAFADNPPSEKSDDVFSILEEEVTVTTGSRVAVKANEAPSSVWVIDRHMIDSTAATSIADLLRRIPGLIPLDQTAGQSEIAVRGFGGEVNNRLLYMIDGRSVILEHYSNNDVAGLPIDIDDIERIEVVMGPSSTLYGANAYSGVVNFITISAEKDGGRVRGIVRGGTQFASHAGAGSSTNTLAGPQFIGTAHVDYSQAFGDFHLRLSAGVMQTDEPPQGSTAGLDPAQIAMPYRNPHGIIDASYEKNGWQLRAQLMATSFQTMFFATVNSASSRFFVQDYALNLQAQKSAVFAAGDQLLIQAWGRFDQPDYTAEVGSGLPGLPTHSPTWSGELLGQYASPEFFHNRLVSGIQVRVLDVEDPDVAPNGRAQGIVGLFAQDEFRPIDPLILTAGVRVETRESEAFKTLSHLTASPRAALVFIPAPGHAIRAEFSTAYRNPAPLEQFQTLQLKQFDFVLIEPNPGLKAEQHIMGQLSYQGKIGPFRPHVEVFLGEKTNLILLTYVGANSAPPLVYANDPNDNLYYGVTAQLAATPISNLDVWGNFNWYQARENPFHGKAFTYDQAPQLTAGLGASYSINRFRFALAVYYENGTTQPDEALVTTYGGAATMQRLIISPMLRWQVDARGIFGLTLAATNAADIRFGPGVARDFVVPDAERIGPRVWLGLDINLGFLKKS